MRYDHRETVAGYHLHQPAKCFIGIFNFSAITLYVKRNIRRLRLNTRYSMNEAARLFNRSLSSKLEDIEAIRNYGSHLNLDLLAKLK